MTGVIIAVHVIVCALLIVIILIQAGRGGGLVQSFSGVESMFGTKTNAFLTKTTTVLSIMFFFTCLTLAVISLKQSKSLMENVKVTAPLKPAAGETKAHAPVTPTGETKAQAATPAATPAAPQAAPAPAKPEPAANAKTENSAPQENPPSVPQQK